MINCDPLVLLIHTFVAVEIPKVTVEDEELALSTPPPPLPPRASKILAQTGMEHSPPLPPRNPNLSSSTPHSILDVVVPVTPLHTPGDRRFIVLSSFVVYSPRNHKYAVFFTAVCHL